MSERMETDLRERAVLPVLIPVAVIVVTEILVFSMSRVLLAAGRTQAVVIALAAAFGILLGAAAIAGQPRARSQTIVGLLVVLGLGTVVAGAVAAQRGAFYEKEGAGAEAPAVDVSASNLAFDTDTIELPAQGAVIRFSNEDTQSHNIAIFPDSESLGDPLFRGQIIDAGAETEYEVPELELGTYYFHCDVHPNMNGAVEVS